MISTDTLFSTLNSNDVAENTLKETVETIIISYIENEAFKIDVDNRFSDDFKKKVLKSSYYHNVFQTLPIFDPNRLIVRTPLLNEKMDVNVKTVFEKARTFFSNNNQTTSKNVYAYKPENGEANRFSVLDLSDGNDIEDYLGNAADMAIFKMRKILDKNSGNIPIPNHLKFLLSDASKTLIAKIEDIYRNAEIQSESHIIDTKIKQSVIPLACSSYISISPIESMFSIPIAKDLMNLSIQEDIESYTEKINTLKDSLKGMKKDKKETQKEKIAKLEKEQKRLYFLIDYVQANKMVSQPQNISIAPIKSKIFHSIAPTFKQFNVFKALVREIAFPQRKTILKNYNKKSLLSQDKAENSIIIDELAKGYQEVCKAFPNKDEIEMNFIMEVKSIFTEGIDLSEEGDKGIQNMILSAIKQSGVQNVS